MTPLWFRNAAIYAIDPRMFSDGSGDGCGDLRGLTRRLDHVRGLGVNCVWLMPMYQSPFRDGGYDVSDHLAIDPRFGNLADLVGFLERADELGIRVLLDLVVQHTSDQHRWFQEARRNRDSPYRDYYVWTDDPENDPATMDPVFPTVEDSVWTWDEVAGQYYRHVFYAHEPDLNHANPKVFEEICRIVAFWLRLGISGFRIDAVPFMVERAAHAGRDDDGFWILRELREYVDLHASEAALLGEVDVPPKEYADYFADGSGLNLLLNFWSSNHLFLSMARQDARPIADAMASQAVPPPHSAYANFLRNHDELNLSRLSESERAEMTESFAPLPEMQAYGRGIRRRLAPMLDHDDDRIALAFAAMMSLPGIPVLLYGDEIGMADDLERPGRLAVRTPMQWRDASAQVTDNDSLLARVGTLVRTRVGLSEVGHGSATVLDAGDHAVLAVQHRSDDGTVVMLANLSDRDVRVDLPGVDPDDLVDVLADRRYRLSDAPSRGIELGAYGYRWLRSSARMGMAAAGTSVPRK